jgi:glycosyltransferase involved in cell wall biosynthesis
MGGKVKVLMVGALPLDLKSVKGGVEAAILNLFSGFSHLNDVEVVHLSFLPGHSIPLVVHYAPNVRICFLPFRSRFRLVDYFVNMKALKKIISEETPDIIHIQESEPHLLRFLRLPKCNIIVTQHGIMREELKYASGLKAKMKFVFKAAVERYVFPLFKNVIFISNYNRNLYRGRLNKSTNIYNAVNMIFFKHQPVRSPNPLSIIYVGVISRRKNLKIVIEALHHLKQRNMVYDLQVVGWYKEKDIEYENEIIGAVKKYGLADQVTFHGWLKQQDILKLYDGCTTFILPSLQETLPVSIAEAMALGKIVIASEVGAISEMFEDTISGYLFRRNNLEDLIALLESLYLRPSLTEKETLIKEMAIQKYHPVENARRTLSFYREVLASN